MYEYDVRCSTVSLEIDLEYVLYSKAGLLDVGNFDIQSHGIVHMYRIYLVGGVWTRWPQDWLAGMRCSARTAHSTTTTCTNDGIKLDILIHT